MGETVTSVPCFEQSVSFGRFERDSLCWERWSTFPTNKYLEEVEKCSTPGSVAQKKAYFEAHYKKISTKKAELLQDQENKRGSELVGLEDRTPINYSSNVSEEGLDSETATPEFVHETDQLENEEHGFMSEVSVLHFGVDSGGANIISQDGDVNLSADISTLTDEMNHGTYAVNEIREVVDLASDVTEHIDELNDCDHVVDEVAKTVVVAPIGELNVGADSIDEIVKSEMTEHVYESSDVADITKVKDSYEVLPEVEHGSEDLCLKEKTPLLENVKKSVLVTEDLSLVQQFQDKEVLRPRKVEGKLSEKETKDPVELVSTKEPQKASFVKKSNTATDAKKKPASPVPKRSTVPMAKSPMLSTSTSLKPELTKLIKADAIRSIKKEICSTPLTSKRTTSSDSKRVSRTSLHMSLSLEPGKSAAASGKSDATSLTTRKSMFMESMGDKDIVKRAFKAFQNVTPPSARNQSASEKVERKRENLRNKTERIGRTANTSSTPTGPQGTKKTLLSPGLKKNVGVEVRTSTSVAAAFGPRVQLQGKKPKEVTKKLDCNNKTTDKETIYLQSRVKAEKPAQVRRPSQTINSKPKLSSSYNQGRGFFNRSAHKEDTKVQASG